MSKRLLWVMAAALSLFLAEPAAAQVSRLRILTLVEYRNAITDHYFMTGDPGEIETIESGRAGAGWARTGTTFEAAAVDRANCPFCRVIHRFFRESNKTHFFTLDPLEIATLLSDPGLRHEGEAFMSLTSLPADPPPTPGPWSPCSARTPEVHRYYNNRPDNPNHRFASFRVHYAMLARGWIDEGVAFCLASGGAFSTFKSIGLRPDAWQSRITTSIEECKQQGDGACLALVNLAPNEVEITKHFSGGPRVKISTKGRKPSEIASAGPYYPLGNQSFRPYVGFPTESELQLSQSIWMNAATPYDASSYVYGHPTLEFVDTRSGLPLHFSVLAFGQDPNQEFLGRDSASGAVIVGTTYRAESPYLQTGPLPTMKVDPLRTHPESGLVYLHGFSTGPREFARVLQRALQVDSRLSPDPADYVLTAIRYKHEIAGNGMIEAAFGSIDLHVVEAAR